MNDTERVLGEIKEFKRQSEKRFDRFEVAVSHRFDKLESEVKKTSHWRWKVTGALTMIIALAELANVFLKQ